MANIKSSKKRIKVSARQTNENKYRVGMKTAIKKLEKAVEGNVVEEIPALLNTAIQKINKAHSKGLVHKNYVARQTSRLTKKVNDVK